MANRKTTCNIAVLDTLYKNLCDNYKMLCDCALNSDNFWHNVIKNKQFEMFVYFLSN